MAEPSDSTKRFNDFFSGLGGEDVFRGEGRRSKQAFEQFQRFRGFTLRDLGDLLTGQSRNPFLNAAQSRVLGLAGRSGQQASQFRGNALEALQGQETALRGLAANASLSGGAGAAQAARIAGGGTAGVGGSAIAQAAANTGGVANQQAALLSQGLAQNTAARVGVEDRFASMNLGALAQEAQLSSQLAQALRGQNLTLGSQALGNLGALSNSALSIAFRQRAANRGVSNFASIAGGIGSIAGGIGSILQV